MLANEPTLNRSRTRDIHNYCRSCTKHSNQGSQQPALKQFPDFPWLSNAAFPGLSLTLMYILYFKMPSAARRKKSWQTSGLRKKRIWIRVEIWFTSVKAKFPDFPWLSTKFPDFPEEKNSPWFSLMLGTLNSTYESTYQSKKIHKKLWA